MDVPDYLPLRPGPAGDTSDAVVVITSTTAGPRVNVAVAGEVDASNVGRLRTALFAHLDAGRTEVLLDVSALSFIDCTGLTVVLTAAACAAAGGGSVRLHGIMQPPVRRIVELTGAAVRLTDPR